GNVALPAGDSQTHRNRPRYRSRHYHRFRPRGRPRRRLRPGHRYRDARGVRPTVTVATSISGFFAFLVARAEWEWAERRLGMRGNRDRKPRLAETAAKRLAGSCRYQTRCGRLRETKNGWTGDRSLAKTRSERRRPHDCSLQD